MDLGHDLEVVLDRGRLGVSSEVGSNLLGLGEELGGGRGRLGEEGRGNVVEGGELSGEVRERSSGGAVGAALLVQVLDEQTLASSELVSLGLVVDVLVRSCGEELDGRVRADAVSVGDRLVDRLVGVEEGNDAVGLLGEGLGDRLVDGLERLAVSAPRGGEGDDDVLGVVERDRVKVGGGQLEGDRRGRPLDLALGSRLLGDAARESIVGSATWGVERVADGGWSSQSNERVEVPSAVVVLRNQRSSREPLES